MTRALGCDGRSLLKGGALAAITSGLPSTAWALLTGGGLILTGNVVVEAAGRLRPRVKEMD